MRTLRVSLAGAVVLALLGGLSGAVAAQGEEAGDTDVVSETVFELLIPSEAMPEDFVRLRVEDWTLAAGADAFDSFRTNARNEAMFGRAIVVDSGEFVIVPVVDALVWRGAGNEPVIAPAGEVVTVTLGEAIFLPAIPDAEVDPEASLRIANPGSEDATARSFHTHQAGGTFSGYPRGLTPGDWDMAVNLQATELFDDVDVLFRLMRISGGPGASIPTAEAPAVGLYYVEEGDVEQVTSGPGGESVLDWPAGTNGFLPRTEGVEQSLYVVGDADASVLELAALPQPSAE